MDDKTGGAKANVGSTINAAATGTGIQQPASNDRDVSKMDLANAARLRNLAKAREAKKRKREEEATARTPIIEEVSVYNDNYDEEDIGPSHRAPILADVDEEVSEEEPPPKRRKNNSGNKKAVRRQQPAPTRLVVDNDEGSLLGRIAYPILVAGVFSALYATYHTLRTGVYAYLSGGPNFSFYDAIGSIRGKRNELFM
jgi:hypothetical protein